MLSRIWTPEELSSNCTSVALEEAWRVVEAQHASSTMKLTDTLDEQTVLESLIDDTKPRVPAECKSLHYLLSSPFRYGPYPNGSRFRRAGHTPGIFYCAERSSTAVAELAFYRLLFYAESPQTPWPKNAAEYTGFCVEFASEKLISLQDAPFSSLDSEWEDLEDYSSCQHMEELCRASGITVIKYQSVRDPDRGGNYALLSCSVFTKPSPTKLESWKLHLGPSGVRAVREFPPRSLEFDRDAFVSDRRIAPMKWDR